MDLFTNGMVWLDLYIYMKDLPALSSCRGQPPHLIISREILTLLRKDARTMELADHPDRTFVTYILSGIQEGFHRSQSLQAMG